MTKKQVAFLAAVGIMSAAFALAQTAGGTICVQENGVNKGCVQYLNFQGDTASWTSRNVAFIGISDAGVSFARYAADAGFANNAGNANTANTATYALDAGQADYAPQAGNANTANTATYATSAGTATTATTASVATYALDAGQANYAPQAGNATTAGTATYALDAGAANYATSANSCNTCTTATSAGSATTCGSCTTADTATYAADAGNLTCLGCIIADRIGLGAVTRLKIGLGAVDHTVVADGGLLGGNITPGGIGTPQLASLAVTNGIIGPFAITEDKIDAGAITSVKILDSAVVESKINAGAVTEAKIGALAVTEAKIGALAVSSGKLQDSAVVEAKLATGAVTNTKIGALAVDSAKLADGSVVEAKVGTGAITNTKIGALAVDSAKLAAAAVTTAKIATGAVTSNELGAAAVTTAKIATGAVTSNELGAAAVTTAKLATGAVTTNELGALAVTTAKIAAGAVTTTELGANAVTNAKLAALSVATGNIQASAVTSNELAANSVTTAKIADSNVTGAKVASQAIDWTKLDDGAPFQSWDEARDAYVYSRITYVNGGTTVVPESGQGFSQVNATSGTTDFYVETNVAYSLARVRFVTVTYRTFGAGWASSSTMVCLNMGNTAQNATATMQGDGTWHTAIFDVSSWTTTGTIRLDFQDGGPAIGASSGVFIAHIGTGYLGVGSGGGTALVNVQGRVGIGLAVPGTGYRLHTSGTNPGIAIQNSGTGGGWLDFLNSAGSTRGNIYYDNASDYMTFGTAGAVERVRIASDGNVGIGTGSPSDRLHVSATGYPAARFRSSFTAGSSRYSAINLGDYASAQGTGLGHIYNTLGGAGYFFITPYGQTEGQQFVLTSTGLVGIGTNNPDAILDVERAAGSYVFDVTNGTDSNFKLRTYNHGSGTVDSVVFTQGLHYGTTENASVKFFRGGSTTGGFLTFTTNNGTERVRVSRDGYVGINNSIPKSWLDVQDNTASGATSVMQWWSWQTTNPPSWGLHLDQIHTGTAIDYVFRTRNGSTADVNTLYLKANGNIGLNTTNPAERLHVVGNIRNSALAGVGNRAVYSDANGNLTNTASDATLKTAVEDLRSPLRMVLALRPVAYNWKDTERFGPQREIGFIAQEVMQVIPEVVGRNADGTYSVDYSKIVAALAGAVQELYDDRTWLARRVQELEDKAAAAEQRLADLEARLARLESK